jgi:hypothetical protein
MALHLKGRLPEWAKVEAEFLYHEYHKLQQWDITVNWTPISKMPRGAEDDGFATYSIPYKLASIHICSRLRDVKDHKYRTGVIAHEFLHIHLTTLENVADQGLQIGRTHRSLKERSDILALCWRDAVESFIEIDLEARGYHRKEE